MYYQTADIVAASGADQSKMVKIPFSTTRKVHAPVDIKLPEDGSYALKTRFSRSQCDERDFRLYW